MTCAKQHVIATIITSNGTRYIGTNAVALPQETCPREEQGFPRNEGYHLCKAVCAQPGHAEDVAIAAAGPEAEGSTLYLEGHHAVCPRCMAACNAAGIAQIIVAPPPRCWCLTCWPVDFIADPESVRMALCPTCGNKRCPRANSCRNACSGSNEPGQPGSAYP